VNSRKEEANFVVRTLLMEHYLQISILYKDKWTYIQYRTAVYTVHGKQVYHHRHQGKFTL
jgi:hypothetical protein